VMRCIVRPRPALLPSDPDFRRCYCMPLRSVVSVLLVPLLFATAPLRAEAPAAETVVAPAPVPATDAAALPAETAPPAETTPTDLLVAAANTELVFEMLDTVSSKTHVRGDAFRLRLALPLVVDGQVLIPAGTPAHGEVVHAASTRWGGEAGELILAARYIDFAGRQIPLRLFQTSIGVSHERLAANLMYAAPIAAVFVRGKHVEVHAGGHISARLREAVSLPSLGPAGTGPAEAGPVDTATTEPATSVAPANSEAAPADAAANPITTPPGDSSE